LHSENNAGMASQALCIGINDYPGSGSDLTGCINDARDWAGAFRGCGLPVTELHDRAATGQAIRECLLQLIAQAEPEETLLIQYSGHGSFVPDIDSDEPDGTDECICPYDFQTDLITDDELFDIFESREKGVRIVMISDSCNSGTVTRFNPILTPQPNGAPGPERRVRFLPPESFLRPHEFAVLGERRRIKRSSPPGRYAALLLSGCQDVEYSYDAVFNGRPNGAFTYVALQALKTLPPDATYRQWHQAIRRILPSQQYPQTPNLYGSRTMKDWKVFQGN
jgi:hypothetical protein